MNQVINVTGQTMPAVGLGLWKLETSEVAETVYNAIKNGYRHLDSAADYGNEQQVGEVLPEPLRTDCAVGKTSGLRLNCGTPFIAKNTSRKLARNLCQTWV